MITYTDMPNEYLQKCQQNGGFSGMESVLEFLWECYSAVTPADGRIQVCEETLRPMMEALPYDASNALFEQITDQCTAYQRAAFLEGITLGAHLQSELNSKKAKSLSAPVGAD